IIKVISPSSEHHIDFANGIPQWGLIITAREDSKFVPYTFHGLLDRKYIEVFSVPASQIEIVAQAKSKKVQSRLTLAHSCNARLFPIHCQPKVTFELAFQPRTNPWTHPLCQHHEIICIAHQTSVGHPLGTLGILMEGSIKVIEVDVGQQRRNHASLRSATFGAGDLLASILVYLYDLTPKPHPDEAQYSPVRYAPLNQFHEPVMWNGIEIARMVRVIDLLSPSPEAFPNLLHGSVSITLRSEPMGAVHEISLEDRLDYQQRGSLDHPVPYTGDTQGAQFPIGLRHVGAFHRKWAVRAASEFFLDTDQEGANPSRAVLNILEGYCVHSWRTSVGFHSTPGSFQYIHAVDPVIERVKSVRRFLFGLATQFPPQKGDFHSHGGFRFEPFGNPFRYGAFLTQAVSPFLDRNATEVRPLVSTGITPLPRYYGPLRLPTAADVQVIDSPHSLSCALTASGLPGSLADLSTRALPEHPERLGWSLCSLLPNRWQASSSPGDWPPPTTGNEAETGLLSLGLASSLSGQDLYPSPKGPYPLDRPTPRVRLPCTGGRSYTLNEQLTCPTPFSRIDQPGLAWRTEEHEGGTIHCSL